MNTVLLFIPNTRWFNKRPWVSIPHSALILSALLKDDYNFIILDANGQNYNDDECASLLLRHNPEIILVSALSMEYHKQYHKALKLAKQSCPKAITILGGVYPTVCPEEAIKDLNLDYVFIGHAEERISNFIELVMKNDLSNLIRVPGISFRDGNSVRLNPVTSYIGDVKNLVRPDFSFMDITPYLVRKSKDYQFNSSLKSASILTSYGCPYNCSFCATRTISGKKTAYRPLEDVIAEIDFLINEHDIQELLFLDDNFLTKKDRAIRMFETLRDNYKISWKSSNVAAWLLDEGILALMKQSGCTQITISVESGSQRVLSDIIHKPMDLKKISPIVQRCQELGICICANFVIGFPGETWDEIRQSFAFAELCDFDLAHFHIATPLPGTDLYKTAVDQNLLPKDFSFFDERYFGFGQAFIETPEFTRSELLILRAYEWDRINFNTPEKTARIAKMYCTTVEDLNEHRKQTRRKLGIHF